MDKLVRPRSETDEERTLVTQKPSFYSEFASLPDRVRHKLTKILEQLERRNGQVDGMKRLQAVDNAYRVRIDDYRLIFIRRGGDVKLLRIWPRKDIYKSLGWITEEALDPIEEVFGDTPDVAPAIATVREGELPLKLNAERLTSWRIPTEHHVALHDCISEDDLQEAKVPYEVFSRVVDLLWPSAYQQLEHAADYLVPSGRLEEYVTGELTSFLLKLDDEQKRIAELNLVDPKGPILVKGGPGSGKSTVALYRIKRLIEHHASQMFDVPRILFTTYTKALTKANRELLMSLLGPEARHIQVDTIDAIAVRIVRACEGAQTLLGEGDPLTLELFAQAKRDVGNLAPLVQLSDTYLIEEIFQVLEARNVATEAQYLTLARHGRKAPLAKVARIVMWQLYEAFLERLLERDAQTWEGLKRRATTLVRQGEYTERYDYIIVDEAQDLTPNAVQLVMELCRKPWGVYLTADKNQSLYQRGFSWSSLHENLNVAGRTHILRRNYRNTYEISLAVREILNGLEGGSEENEWIEGSLVGELPKVIEVDPNNEIPVLKHIIKDACRRQRQPYMNAAILVAGDQKRVRERGVEIAENLKAAGLHSNYMSSAQLRLDARCVKVMSLHASKGLEFPIVVIVDVHEGILPRELGELPPEEADEELAKDRRLFYVGASRAMRSLTVVARTGQTSRFLKELSLAHWQHSRK